MMVRATVPRLSKGWAKDAGRGPCHAALVLAIACAALTGSAAWVPVPAATAAQTMAAAISWRIAEHELGLRIVLDLSRPIDFKIFRLADPDRVVVDMPEIDWRGLAHEGPLRAGAVSGVRYGVPKSGSGRLVVDASAPLTIRAARLLDPEAAYPHYRLVIDLDPESHAPAQAVAGRPKTAGPEVAAKPAAPPAFWTAPPPATAAVAPAAAAPPPLLIPTLPPAAAVAPPKPAAIEAAPPGAAPLGGPMAIAPIAAPPPPRITSPPSTRPSTESRDEPTRSLLPSLTAQAMAAPALAPRGLFEGAAVIVPIEPPFRPAPIPKPDDPRRVVVIDPGHGGVDPGAISLGGAYEKSITLAIAQEAERQLTATGRYKVQLTRTDDSFIRLRDRVAIARQAGADLFISIHADTINNRAIGGMSIYTLSETASDHEAEALATKENKADIIAGVDLRDETPQVSTILIDLAQRETKNLSAKLARAMIDEMGHDRRLLPKPHRFAGFAVLTAPDMPSILIELGYLSNQADERELMDPGYRLRLGRDIQRAIDRFFAAKDRLRRS
jgi:N-acetylmuramoyl-L-alanine amidase